MPSHAKIITVTANTAIDYVLKVNNLSLGANVIAESAAKFASGKGINVAKAIASLAYPVWVSGFVGSKSWAFFKELNCELVTVDYTLVEGETRTNLTLFDSQKPQETHIRTQGFSVTAADCQSLIAKLSAGIHKNDIVVLSGSLPEGAPSDFYQALIEVCHAKSALAFLDSSGESLKQGLNAKPYLIKPNQAEFEALVGHSLKDEQAIINAARAIVATGVKWVIVSRAEQGALLVGENVVLIASVVCHESEIISYVGCGDALVAGFAFAILHGYQLQETLKFAVACGAANLFSLEPGRFKLETLAQIMPQVHIRAL
jgi:1-phosphofructokinase